ncbi:MAG: HAD hydrolase-like protein [Verrucomicrobiota bacterium]|nr:HAD hydrolase-like protein [Verrucomicrobiota bacterium]
MIKLILFDIDGTLIRTGGAGVKAFARAFATEFGLVDGTERLKFAGRTDVSLVREFFSHHQIVPSPEHFNRFFAAYLSHLEKIILQTESEICPGVLDFMKSLRALPSSPLLGLLTGNIRRGAEIKLTHFHLWKEFLVGAFADDHEERDGIAAIAKKRGGDFLAENLRGENVLVIGDTPLDIRCARSIDAKVLAVATGASKVDELSAHKPDWVVEDLRQISDPLLVQILDSL